MMRFSTLDQKPCRLDARQWPPFGDRHDLQGPPRPQPGDVPLSRFFSRSSTHRPAHRSPARRRGLPEMKDWLQRRIHQPQQSPQTGPRRTPPHQPRARRTLHRLRRGGGSPQSISIMINEEDHFRIQGIRPGLDLRSAYHLVDTVDSELESELALRLLPRIRLPHRLSDQSRHRHESLRHAALARPRHHRPNRPSRQSRRQDRPRRSRSLWRGHRGARQPLPNLQSAHPRRKRDRNHRPDRKSHRRRRPLRRTWPVPSSKKTAPSTCATKSAAPTPSCATPTSSPPKKPSTCFPCSVSGPTLTSSPTAIAAC
jgi:hypothetical protein